MTPCDHGFGMTVCPNRHPPSALRDMEDIRPLACDWAVDRYGLDGDDAEGFSTYCAGEVADLAEIPARGFESCWPLIGRRGRDRPRS